MLGAHLHSRWRRRVCEPGTLDDHGFGERQRLNRCELSSSESGSAHKEGPAPKTQSRGGPRLVRTSSGRYANGWAPHWSFNMASSSAIRDDRIELRATREEKRLIAEAAAREQLDVTRFIMRNVLPVARDVVKRSERIVLSERDSKRVLELLEKPPKPTSALVAAARRRAKA